MKPIKLIPQLFSKINAENTVINRAAFQIHRVNNTHIEPESFIQQTIKKRSQVNPIITLNQPALTALSQQQTIHSPDPATVHPILSSVNNPSFLSSTLQRKSESSATTPPTPEHHSYKSLHLECGLPPFSALKGIDIVSAIVKATEFSQATINQVINQNLPPSWETVCEPLEKAEGRIDYLQGLLQHLNMVLKQRSFTLAEELCTPILNQHAASRTTNPKLYAAYKSVKESATFNQLSNAKQRAINHKLTELKCESDSLSVQQQMRLTQINTRLNALSTTFSDNVMAATNHWNLQIVDKDKLRGMPSVAKAIAKEKAEKKGLDGYLLTLDDCCFSTVMATCENGSIRQKMYTAFVTRASEIDPNSKKWDNSPIMAEILTLRQEAAILQGFANFSDYAMSERMAPSSDAVFKFLQELTATLLESAADEQTELTKYANEKYGIQTIEPWDVSFYSAKLKQHKFDISTEELSAYFPKEKVLEGLFAITKRLYGVTITANEKASTWHPDVTLYEMRDENGLLCGRFYLDLYAREGKQSGAWFMGAQPRQVSSSGSIQYPDAYIVCNFDKPAAGFPSNLTHHNVTTLFHEMGHGLHHMLTNVDASAVSGTNQVPRDGVELPSLLMENWCWNKEALKLISSHQHTGAPLPNKMIDNLLAAKNFHGAKALLNRIKFSLFDMVFHSGFDLNETTINDMTKAVNEHMLVNDAPDFVRSESCFKHIFSGGYSAGYYSYLWSEVMSAAVFERFEKEGILNRKIGEEFLQHILSKGGSEDMMALLVRFLGEEPSMDAFLQQHGLKK